MFITTVVFLQVYRHDFISYDDDIYVYDNLNIQQGITFQSIKWAFTTGRNGNWHPLTWLSHILDWQLFKNNPAGHHLINLFFHIANTLLLFLVLKQMTKALWQSAFVAVLFAVHPLHIESVAWVSERKDVLSTFFWLLTMTAYLRYTKNPNIASYTVTLLSFVLGLMTKPMLITLPFVLLLLDYWPLARDSTEETIGKAVKRNKQHPESYRHTRVLCHLALEKIPFFSISAISCVVTFFTQRSSGAIAPTTQITLKFRIFNAVISYARYIEKTIWPSKLAVFYPLHIHDLTIRPVIASLLLLSAISFVVIRLAKRRRYIVTGWLWYLVTLLPVIGLVQVGSQSMADRYTYITLIGLFIIIAWGMPDLLNKWRYKRVTLTVSGLLIISVMSISSYLHLRYWQNNNALFQHAIDVTQNNHIGYFHLAQSLYKQRRFAEAAEEYKKFIRIIPDDPSVFNKLGIALLQQSKTDEAIPYLREAVRLKPDFADAHMKLGYALLLEGNIDEAGLQLSEALSLDPNLAAAHHHLGQVLIQKGKVTEALKHFEEAIRLRPGWVEPVNHLAWFLATSDKPTVKNPEEAVKLALQACEITQYKYPDLLDTLAAAYAAKGDFDMAVKTAEMALQLCQSTAQDKLKKDIRKRLFLYKTGKSYTEGN